MSKITRRLTGFIASYIQVEDDDTVTRASIFIPTKIETVARKKAEKALLGTGILRDLTYIDELRAIDVNVFFAHSEPVTGGEPDAYDEETGDEESSTENEPDSAESAATPATPAHTHNPDESDFDN